MNNISIIGIGKLGLAFALNLERKGFNVIGVDTNKDYVAKINDKSLKSDEPKIEEFLKESKNFIATTDIAKAVESEIVFIVVATPSLKDGGYNHTHIDDVIKSLVKLGRQKTTKYLVISSTVMPGYCSTLKVNDFNYEIVYNPEFIAQGTIIRDQLNPDIILLGSYSQTALEKVENIYKSFCDNKPDVCKMSLTESEITKIALNCFLTTKIAYANMVGDVATRAGCNPEPILAAIGRDSRIGSKYLKYGYGYGGPCFPRDNRAFGVFCKSKSVYPYIGNATDQSNKQHLEYQLDEFKKTNPKKGSSVILEGVAFKKGSTILDESQQLSFAIALTNDGYDVTIKDNASVIEQLKKIYGQKFKYIVE